MSAAPDRGEAAPRKRVLLIAFHFPPGGGSGTQRAAKFARYLPEFGWDVEVLTVHESAHELLDESLLEEIPAGIRIHRCRWVDLGGIWPGGNAYPDMLAFPDRYVPWLAGGIPRGRRVLREAHFDAVLSTSPARTAHLLGRSLARWSRLPWVVDFRDPWTMGSGQGWRRRRLDRLEASILRESSHIIANTPALAERMGRLFPDVPPEKVTILPNGYDEADFRDARAAPRQSAAGCLEMVHTGEIYPSLRDPRPLLEAFQQLLEQDLAAPDQLRIRFIGSGADFECGPFPAWLAGRGLSHAVSLEPYLSHARCIEELLSAGALLLLQCSPAANGQIPAKAFEYLRTGKPVLTLAPAESATASLMRSEGAGWEADPADLEQVRRALHAMLERFRSGGWGQAAPRGARYERRALTGELAGILNRCLGAPAGGR